MKLNDPLVSDIEFNGVTFPLDLSFDNVLDVFEILKDETLENFEKVDSCCELLIGENELSFTEQSELFTFILENHIHSSEQQFIEVDILGNPMPNQEERVIDIELDAKFIYASFFVLGINLFEQQGKLSWTEFQALLEALPDESVMSKIINIRQWSPSKGDSQEHISEMRRLQKNMLYQAQN
ncbi:Gp15 family bacteriophage protein [Enterococcus termitis]